MRNAVLASPILLGGAVALRLSGAPHQLTALVSALSYTDVDHDSRRGARGDSGECNVWGCSNETTRPELLDAVRRASDETGVDLRIVAAPERVREYGLDGEYEGTYAEGER